MRALYTILFFTLTLSLSGHSQPSGVVDSLNTPRLIGASIGTGALWSGSMVGLYQVWYSKSNQSSFHFFNDNHNWLQMDKIGHVYTAYKISEVTSDLFRWTRLKPITSSFIGTSIGIGYQTTLELFDAYSTDWGFSWGDITSNIVGSSLYLGQELAWSEQRILPKFSYHPTQYAAIRPEILGSNHLERLLKDYNGQTYWLSFSPGTFLRNSSFPSWLCFSFGYSVDAKLKGDEEIYFNFHEDGTSTSYQSEREFLFSMDLDLSQLPVKKMWVKRVLKQLNHLKIPFPAIQVSNGKIQGKPFYF